MANTENEFPLGYIDKRREKMGAEVGGANDSYATSSGTERYGVSVAALRTALTTFNAGLYTTARLNNMTKNDMVYALRLANDAAGI